MSGGIVDTLRVNNSTFGWNSCLFLVDGIGTEGIVAIDYEEQLDVRAVPSQQTDAPPLGLSPGGYKVGRFPIRMLRDSAVAFKTYLQEKAAAGATASSVPTPSGSYGQAVFTLALQLAAIDSPTGQASTVTFAGCRVVGEKAVHDEGIDEAVTEFRIGCLAIDQDGNTLWNAIPPLVGGFPAADTISIFGTTMPGKWTLLSCDKEFGLEERKAIGLNGATAVVTGDPLMKPVFSAEFWDPADFQRFSQIRTAFLKKPLVSTSGALVGAAPQIDHPELKALGCTAVLVKKVTPLIPDEYGVWSCRIEFLQYRPPKLVLANKADAVFPDTGTMRPTALTAQQQELQTSLAEHKELAAQEAQAIMSGSNP